MIRSIFLVNVGLSDEFPRRCAIIERMEPQMSALGYPIGSERVDMGGLAKLAEAVRQALYKERESCEAQVVGGNSSSADLWEDMPTVDSKTVARLAPVFKRHTGRPLNIRRIRPGGYDSVEEAVQHLVYGDDESD